MPKRPAIPAPSFLNSVPHSHLSDQPTDRPVEDGRKPRLSKKTPAETVPQNRVYRFPFHPLLQIKVPHRNSVPCSLSPDGPNGREHMKKDLPATASAKMDTSKVLDMWETRGVSEKGDGRKRLFGERRGRGGAELNSLASRSPGEQNTKKRKSLEHTAVDARLLGDQHLAVLSVLTSRDDSLAKEFGPGLLVLDGIKHLLCGGVLMIWAVVGSSLDVGFCDGPAACSTARRVLV